MGTFTKTLSGKILLEKQKSLQSLSQKFSQQQTLEKAEEISDGLESILDDLDETIYQEILESIINQSSQENDYELQEVLLNSVANAMSQRDCSQDLELSPLIKQIDQLKGDCLLHALDIIGLSRNLSYLEVIQPFLKHSNLEVRETAKIALSEIESSNDK